MKYIESTLNRIIVRDRLVIKTSNKVEMSMTSDTYKYKSYTVAFLNK